MRGKWREHKETKMVRHSRWEPKISENNRRKQGEKSKWSQHKEEIKETDALRQQGM